MYQKLGEVAENILAIRINDTITDKETRELDRMLKETAAKSGTIRLLLVIDHYTTLNSAEALYEDLRFAKINAEHIDRMAVVGDKVWKRTWVSLFGLFGGIQAEYFATTETEDAQKWLLG